MQDEISIAVYERLAGIEVLTGDQATAQSGLAALLATDSDSPSGPAVMQGNRDDVVGFPAITFRLMGGNEALGGIDFGVVRNYWIDMEVWTNSTSGRIIHQIGNYIEVLLDERRGAPGLPVSAGRYFWMEALAGMQPIYDEKINAWAGLCRYQVVAGKV
jgi:hypothetical protein